jgi:hypothetical protein
MELLVGLDLGPGKKSRDPARASCPSQWEIRLEDWLPSPSHISKHALPKVPSQIDGAPRRLGSRAREEE